MSPFPFRTPRSHRSPIGTTVALRTGLQPHRHRGRRRAAGPALQPASCWNLNTYFQTFRAAPSGHPTSEMPLWENSHASLFFEAKINWGWDFQRTTATVNLSAKQPVLVSLFGPGQGFHRGPGGGDPLIEITKPGL